MGVILNNGLVTDADCFLSVEEFMAKMAKDDFRKVRFDGPSTRTPAPSGGRSVPLSSRTVGSRGKRRRATN